MLGDEQCSALGITEQGRSYAVLLFAHDTERDGEEGRGDYQFKALTGPENGQGEESRTRALGQAQAAMTIQTFIEKAIEGGWDCHGLLANDEGMGTPRWEYDAELIVRKVRIGFGGDPTPVKYHVTLSEIMLDVEAWKAVGKVEGWTYEPGKADPEREPWHRLMVGMIDDLAEGKTVEEYLETL